MAITVASDLKPSTETSPFPCVASAALSAPGPLAVDTTQNNAAKQIKVVAAVAANRHRYIGYSLFGATAAGDNPAPVSGCIVNNFAGVTPGSEVFIADDGTLTHTQPAADVLAIGLGVRSDAIYFYHLGPKQGGSDLTP